jgi:hypothetical protein
MADTNKLVSPISETSLLRMLAHPQPPFFNGGSYAQFFESAEHPNSDLRERRDQILFITKATQLNSLPSWDLLRNSTGHAKFRKHPPTAAPKATRASAFVRTSAGQVGATGEKDYMVEFLVL